jgi:hypothetical protein
MTQRIERPFLLRAATAVVIGFAAPVLALSGCTSANIEDVVPSSSTASQSMLPAAAPLPAPNDATAGASVAAVETAPAPVEAASAGAAKNTGVYPNLNIAPQAANEQISPEEKAAQIAAMQAAKSSHAAKAASARKGTADPNALRVLAKTHAADALKKIEGQP